MRGAPSQDPCSCAAVRPGIFISHALACAQRRLEQDNEGHSCLHLGDLVRREHARAGRRAPGAAAWEDDDSKNTACEDHEESREACRELQDAAMPLRRKMEGGKESLSIGLGRAGRTSASRRRSVEFAQHAFRPTKRRSAESAPRRLCAAIVLFQIDLQSIRLLEKGPANTTGDFARFLLLFQVFQGDQGSNGLTGGN
jgi:hypothetical protein